MSYSTVSTVSIVFKSKEKHKEIKSKRASDKVKIRKVCRSQKENRLPLN